MAAASKKNTRLVYRVENASGLGPYKATPRTDTIQDMVDSHNDSMRHPAPGTDPGLGVFMHKDYFCGFGSQTALKKWFRGWRTHLRTAGFHVAVYRAPGALISKDTGQAIFKKHQAKKVQTLPIP